MTTPFATALRTAMTRRRATNRTLAADTGTHPSTIGHYRSGRMLPNLLAAAALAEALDWPSLVEIVTDARTTACAVCGKAFVAFGHGGHPRRFCSAPCRELNRMRAARVSRAATLRPALTRATTELEQLRAAVAGMCGTCTLGEAICRDDACDLRDVSPLPFIPLSKVTRRAA